MYTVDVSAARRVSGFSSDHCGFTQDGQLQLKELTAVSLDKLLEGHNALQTQQGKLYEGQEQMESSLRDNLLRLSQEKALIASGQELVAQLIQGITLRIGESFEIVMHFALRAGKLTTEVELGSDLSVNIF